MLVVRRLLADAGRRDAAVYICATALQRATLFLVLPLLLSRLSIAEYGAFGLLQSIISLFPALLTLNLPATVTRLYFDGPSQTARNRIVAQLSLLALTIGAIVTGSSIAAVLSAQEWFGVLLGVKPPVAVLAISLALLGAFGSAQLQVAYGIWRAEQRSLVAAGANVGTAVLFLGAAGLLAAMDRLTLVTALGAMGGAFLVGGVLATSLATRWSSIRRGPLHDVFREAVRYGLPVLPYILGLWVLTAGGRWIARGTLDLEAVAQYTLASQLAYLAGMIGRSAYEAWAPRSYQLIAEGRHAEAMEYLNIQGRRTVTMTVVISILIAVGLYVALSRFAAHYAPAAGLFPVMAIAPVLDVAHLKSHTLLLGLKRTKAIGLYTAFSVGFFIVSGIYLGGTYGLWGVAASYPLAYAVQFTAATMVANHHKRELVQTSIAAQFANPVLATESDLIPPGHS
jgi:O-antigen/teichoic acid export membrane protein